MKASKHERYKVLGYARYRVDQSTGFMLPLFVDLRDRRPIIQIVDESNETIADFAPVATSSEENIVYLNTNQTASKGESTIFIFVDKQESINIGTVASLEPTLRRYVTDSREFDDVVVQINELIGSRYEKRGSRMWLNQRIATVSGAQAAGRYYLGSALSCAFWDNLREAAHDVSAARSLLELRRTITRNLTDREPTLLQQAIWELISPLICLTPSEIAAAVRADLGLGDFVTPSNEKDTKSKSAHQSWGSTIRRDVETYPTQEGRVAAFLDWVIRFPDATLEILEDWYDRGKFANLAIELLRQRFRNSHRTNEAMRTVAVAHMVGRLYTLCFPMQRGRLLLGLAERLAQHEFISRAIQRKLRETRSMYVEPYRAAIVSALDPQDATRKSHDR